MRVGSDPAPVLLITGSLGPGGTELAVAALASGLRRRGTFSPTVAVLARGGDLGAALARDGVPVVELGIEGRLRRPAAVRRLLRLARHVRRERTAVVHTFLFDADVYGMLAARLGRPGAVISTRRAIKSDKPHHLRGYRWTHRFVDRIVANSERVARFTVEREGAPPDKVLTIPNGVDRSRFAAVVAGRFRRQLGLPEDALLAVALGSVKPVKGQDVLLEAALEWMPRHPDAHLVLAGACQGDFAADLLRRAGEAGLSERIHAPGPVAAVEELLADADVFVLPSRSEGMSNALLEAMASGLPAVATDVGGNRECLADGECGILVPPEDPGALAAALESLTANPQDRRQLGERARARVDQRYDLERILERTEILYRELLA